MKIPFSIRHEKIIEENKLKVFFNNNQRTKILYLLQDYNEIFDEVTETNWRYSESSFEKVYGDLIKSYGYKVLKSYVNGDFVEVKQLDEFISGTKPEYILDSIEFLYDYVIGNEKKQSFTKDLNQLLKVIDKPIRFIEGDFFRLDSEFVESEILFKTEKLLREASFDKAHEDFIDARKRLSTGDYSGSIISANNSIESYLKKLLDKKNENQGSLKKTLLKSNLIPDYFNGFLDYFEGLLQSVFTIANKSSRHGQIDLPNDKNKVDEPIASFCLNLVGTLIVFITERHLEANPKEKTTENITDNMLGNDDLPF